MAITGLKSSKVTFYKMVSLPGVGGSKDAAVKSTQVSYRAFTTGLNRIGATINSTIVVNKQIGNYVYKKVANFNSFENTDIFTAGYSELRTHLQSIQKE